MQLNSAPSYIDVLHQVAIAYTSQTRDRPLAQAVVQALVEAEKAAKHEHHVIPVDALTGEWRLCFTAGRATRQQGNAIVGRGWYLPKPIPAQIGFYPDPDNGSAQTGTITNQLKIAGVTLKFSGVYRALGRKNIVAFDFLNLELRSFGRSLFKQEVRGGQAKAADVLSGKIQKLPFFAFFMATDQFIAARGRGGGLAIWVKASDV